MNLTFSGCGFLGLYHLGVVNCLRENAPDLLANIKCYGGASAGAFAAIALALDLDLTDSTEFVLRIAKRAHSLTLGPLHPSFKLVETIKKTFQTILPDNAHELASGRLHISLTRFSDMKNVIVSEFDSKEDLIEAIIATSFVPLYSGFIPPLFRGVRYVDGGISNNLPEHFLEGETITVSPWCGESDICPMDGSSNFASLHLKNTSVQFTVQNFYRLSRAFFPPDPDILCDMCKQGFKDCLRYLQIYYPKMLHKKVGAKVRKLSNVCTNSFCCEEEPKIKRRQTWNEPFSGETSPFSSEPCSPTPLSPQSESSCSSENVWIVGYREESEVEENEPVYDCTECKLHMLLDSTKFKEQELWSCYIIRKFNRLLGIFLSPWVISVDNIILISKRVLKELSNMNPTKTGCNFLDHLMFVICHVLHTYYNKHKVKQRSAGVRRESLVKFEQSDDGTESLHSPTDSCISNESYSSSSESCYVSDLDMFALKAWEDEGGACQLEDSGSFVSLCGELAPEDFIFVDSEFLSE